MRRRAYGLDTALQAHSCQSSVVIASTGLAAAIAHAACSPLAAAVKEVCTGCATYVLGVQVHATTTVATVISLL